MIEYICEQCNKPTDVLHYDHTKCIHCGKSLSKKILKTSISSTVLTVFTCLKERDFDKVIVLCDNYIESDDNSTSDIYWMRMLASNRCINDFELVKQGINIRNNIDKIKAYLYANELEKHTINILLRIFDDTQRCLKSELHRKKIALQKQLKMDSVQKRNTSNIFSIMTQYHNKLTELSKIEQEMMVVYNCLESAKRNCKSRVEQSHINMERLLETLNKISTLTVGQYNIHNETILKNTTVSNFECWRLEWGNYAMHAEYKELLEKHTDTLEELKMLLNGINNYQNEISSIIKEYDNIENHYQVLIDELDAYKWDNIQKFIDAEKYAEIVSNCFHTMIANNF